MSSSTSSKRLDQLSDEQLARIERNRQKALIIRRQKQEKLTTNELFSLEAKHRIGGQSGVGQDSGGGFLIEEDFDGYRDANKDSNNGFAEDLNQMIECIECELEFNKSFLFRNFLAKICDNCKDLKDKHSLITRTEAKTEYLLKDCDLDKREPSLRYIAKKNPHQFAGGDMKLYLRAQVEDRALQVWGSEEALEEERHKRLGQKHKRKQKQYEKRLKSLRMSVRSSLYTKQTQSHCHDFEEEVYKEDEDVYEKRCKSCGYLESYEKM